MFIAVLILKLQDYKIERLQDFNNELNIECMKYECFNFINIFYDSIIP